MYEVNPVYYDVPQAHLTAAIDAQLAQLDRASEALSSAVDARVHDYKDRIQNVRQRLLVARAKIQQLAQSAQAVVIYSAGSFPVPEEQQRERFKRLLPEDKLIPSKTFEEIHRPPSGGTRRSEGLQFLQVRQVKSELESFKLPPKGLGSIQKRKLRNVSDILVFNSTTNPYSEEPTVSVDSSSQEEEEQEPEQTSPSAGSNLTMPSLSNIMDDDDDDSLNYDPGTDSMPELDLPDDLSNVDGFITNLPDLLPGGQFQSKSSSSFMSTKVSKSTSARKVDINNLPELPDISDSPTPQQIVTPPPPPPPPSQVAVNLPPVQPEPPKPSVTASVAPPPPPPPPAAAPPPPPPPTTSAPKAAPVAVEGDRSSLLAAIRNHGGVGGLKGARKEPKRPPPKQAETKPPAMDHMAALKERLSRMRGEIAGGNRAPPPDVAKPQQSGGGIMDALMKKITVNPEDSDSESVNEDDNADWD